MEGADLAAALGVAEVRGLERLSGGASRETWRFEAVGAGGRAERLVLRRDPPGRPGVPGSMANEADAMRACRAVGLPVPEVVVDHEAPSPWESAGLVMRHVEGETLARRILRDDRHAAARAALAGDCARFLAGLHALPLDAVPGLGPPVDPLARCREQLALVGSATPTMELAFQRLAADRPPPRPPVVVHGDFRLGNLLVDEQGLAAVLDWELLHAGDPVEDLGWLCTKAWRFGSGLPVGGFATREELLAAYRDAGGADVAVEELRWWEAVGSLKWAVGCMGQGAAHLTGADRSVELAAVGRRVCEQEWDLLLWLAPEAAERHRAPALAAAEAVTGSATGVAADGSAAGSGGGLHGRPTAIELLEAVEEHLRDQVLPATEGRLSFLARVAANVVATARREAVLGPAQAERRAVELRAAGVGSEAELAAAIAAGRFDGREDELHGLLAAGVAAKLAVANPRYLQHPA